MLLILTCDDVEYTIHVTNIGDVAANNTYVADSFPEGLEVDPDSISHDGYILNGVITWVLNLTAGESVDLTYVARVAAYGNLTNIVAAGNNSNKTIISVPEIIVNKFTENSTYYYFDDVEYTIEVKNIGNVDANNVHIGDSLPEGVEVINGTISHGGYLLNTVIARVIDIKANETILLTYHVIVKELGNLTNLVTVGNNTDNNTIEVLPTADVAINISMPDKATVGDEVQVNITVTNYGPSDAENVVAKWIYNGITYEIVGDSYGIGDFTNGNWNIGTLKVSNCFICANY